MGIQKSDLLDKLGWPKNPKPRIYLRLKTEEGYSADIYHWRYMSALCLHDISRGIYVFFVRCCADIVRILCGHISPGMYICPHYILLRFSPLKSSLNNGKLSIVRSIIFFPYSIDLSRLSVRHTSSLARVCSLISIFLKS